MKLAETRLLGLTKNEVKVVNVLSHVPMSLHEVEKRTKLPHASVVDTLMRLTRRGVIETVNSLRRKTYICRTEVKFGTSNKKTASSIADIEIYNGKEELLSLISTELLRHKHSRLLSFHGERVVEGWLAVLPPGEIKKRNELIVEHDIIVERFVPEHGYKKLFKKLPNDWQKTMVGRTQITHFLPDEYFDTKTELMMFSDVVMIYETHRKRITLFRDYETVKLYTYMFEMMRTVSLKVNSEEEFQNYLKL